MALALNVTNPGSTNAADEAFGVGIPTNQPGPGPLNVPTVAGPPGPAGAPGVPGPNVTTSGLAEMFEYENAMTQGYDQVNTYHPIVDAALQPGFLSGWTTKAAAQGNYTSVTLPSTGLLTFNGATNHGMLPGEVVFITSASDVGYRPPNQTIFKIVSVTTNTFTVSGLYTNTASGTWARGASLIAGSSAAGNYRLSWACSLSPVGTNKDWKIEPVLGIDNVDKAAQANRLTSSQPQSSSSSCFVTIVAGDAITLAVANLTDASDYTIVDLNFNLQRYAA